MMAKHYLIPATDYISVVDGMKFLSDNDLNNIGQEITREEARQLMLTESPDLTEQLLQLYLSTGQFLIRDGRRIVTRR
jgi:hypothetical protein